MDELVEGEREDNLVDVVDYHGKVEVLSQRLGQVPEPCRRWGDWVEHGGG